MRIMDDTANPQSEHGDLTGEAASARAKSQPQSASSLLDALGNGVRNGTEDARTAAEYAIPKVKSAAAGAVYWTAYGVSFAAVFHWALAKGLTPECLKSGVRDGVKAGEDVAQKWIEKLRQRKGKAPDVARDQAVPSADACQPGAA